MANYYQILGISDTASQSEVKRAFRAKAKFLHPDMNSDKNAKSDFQKINAAYQTLNNPKKRKLYDWKLINHKPHSKMYSAYHNVAYSKPVNNPASRQADIRNSNADTKFEKFMDYFLFITLFLIGIYALLYGMFRLFMAPDADINPYPAIVLGVLITSLMIFIWHKKTK